MRVNGGEEDRRVRVGEDGMRENSESGRREKNESERRRLEEREESD